MERWLGELEPLDDDTPRFLAMLRARGVIDGEAWTALRKDATEAARFLRRPQQTVTKNRRGELVLDLDADPRNANWLRISGAQRRAGFRLPMWGAMWVWSSHYEDSDRFWRRVGTVACALGYERFPRDADERPPEPFVVGVDGTPEGWVAVVLRDGRFVDAEPLATFEEVLARFSSAAAIGIDIPIGLVDQGCRGPDVLARAVLGDGRRSSVFLVPPRHVLEAATYEEALARCRAHDEPGLSRQAWALRDKILDVDALTPTYPPVFEVHPEVSFHALNWGPLGTSKRSWNGMTQRRRLLARANVVVPDDLPKLGRAAPDDVLDAAVAAWTADRVARGVAGSLPADPSCDAWGHRMAIWY